MPGRGAEPEAGPPGDASSRRGAVGAAATTAAPAPPLVWQAWLRAADGLDRRFAGHYRAASFMYQQPTRLQRGVVARLRRPYEAPVAYTDWGPREGPLLVCLGGVANTAMRFAFLAADLARAGHRVLCMDWLGRGRSGWLADGSEYQRATYLEQLHQLLAQPGVLAARAASVSTSASASGSASTSASISRRVTLLGSSMGGSVAMAYAARYPKQVQALVLNDVGPHIPQARRARRAQTLARHYVFRSPQDLMRRAGASQKHDGPVPDDVRHFIAWHQTRWSSDEGGRIYRHDPRAMLAYHRDAASAVDQWPDWHGVRCPVLLLHGQESDALTLATISRMRRRPAPAMTVAHVPDTGHTPVLSDRYQTALIASWLGGGLAGPCELSVLHAPVRREAPPLPLLAAHPCDAP